MDVNRYWSTLMDEYPTLGVSPSASDVKRERDREDREAREARKKRCGEKDISRERLAQKKETAEKEFSRERGCHIVSTPNKNIG